MNSQPSPDQASKPETILIRIVPHTLTYQSTNSASGPVRVPMYWDNVANAR